MLHKIEQWISETNLYHNKRRVCCSELGDNFNGFFSSSFLGQAYYVVVDEIPIPDFPELRAMGFGDFLDLNANGITYKNTYYIVPSAVSLLRTHFHELVHVAQWEYLGALPFIERYMREIKTVGYAKAPLERMAYTFDSYFSQGGKPFDVPQKVSAVLD